MAQAPRQEQSVTREESGEEFDRVLETVRKHADNPSAFLALNSGNAYFFGSDGGCVAYRRAGRFLIQFGGVFAAPERQGAVLEEFRAFARRERRRIVGVQLQREDAELYAGHGFTLNQLGGSYGVQLPEFSLRGSKFVKLRNKISRAKRLGLQVQEAPVADHAERIAAIDAAWLRSKGRHVKEIEFMVGQVGGPAQRHRRLFLGLLEGRPIAYISYSPVYGSRSGWLHDLSRRMPDTPPGVMEAINASAVESFRGEGAQWLHFGFTPFTALDPRHELTPTSPLTNKFLRLLADHGEAVYPAASQLAYKEKWAPELVLPEYLAFDGGASMGAVWRLLRVTKSV